MAAPGQSITHIPVSHTDLELCEEGQTKKNKSHLTHSYLVVVKALVMLSHGHGACSFLAIITPTGRTREGKQWEVSGREHVYMF